MRRPTSSKSGVWHVYLARCADGTYYTGIALDVVARVAAHDAGKGARYTRGRGPLVVCGVRRCPSKGEALRLERHVKRLTRAAKAKIAEKPYRLAAYARSLARPARDAAMPPSVSAAKRSR